MSIFKRKNKAPAENRGCFATNRVTADGMRVGYMYREKPDLRSDFPDSGWRFFAGDESDEYANDPQNIRVFDLATICKLDGAVKPYLNAPYGTAWVRDGERFKEDT